MMHDHGLLITHARYLDCSRPRLEDLTDSVSSSRSSLPDITLLASAHDIPPLEDIFVQESGQPFPLPPSPIPPPPPPYTSGRPSSISPLRNSFCCFLVWEGRAG
ncbi:MAG: hypothetical protein FRX48_03336 [Lasallia pustulata]|uniref:Uncharacterized protein n=1 Tax=Lasallia pustulata TaxID=136370 RepID=A0A5M8PVD6_9LECA|nr:MAG: hypothetical protein FRX48_03336 [Lasallia pustulata]